MRKALFFLTFVAGCASGLGEGTYDVDVIVVASTCGSSSVGDSEWVLSEADGTWSMSVPKTGMSASGAEDGDGRVTFKTSEVNVVDGCTILADFEFVVTPIDGGFTGSGSVFAFADCDGSSCTTTYTLNGKAR